MFEENQNFTKKENVENTQQNSNNIKPAETNSVYQNPVQYRPQVTQPQVQTTQNQPQVAQTQAQTTQSQPQVAQTQSTQNQPTQSSYTWGANNYNQYTTRPPVQRTPPAPKKPKSTFGIGKIILTIVLCCIISSASSIGIFSLLVENGYTKNNNDQNVSSFVINKIVDSANANADDAQKEVSLLTKQQIAQKVLPSVVCIQNYQQVKNYSLFGQSNSSSEIALAGEGSGIIMNKDGYIVTNAHVVDDFVAVKVITTEGNTYDAEVIGSDEVTDLAVIKIDATEELIPAEFGSSDDLVVADEVVAVGNPGGMTFNSSVTIGYVSALNREITTGDSGYIMNMIQTDAAINPGNSGGALVNQYGQVIGINSAKFTKDGYEGLGFAIPINFAQPIISDLQNYGTVMDRAVLGISGEFIDNFTASYNGVEMGMLVREITSDEAKNAGLLEYDLITHINGAEVSTPGTLTSILATYSIGDTVTLTVDRLSTGENNMEIQVVLTHYEIDV